MFLLGIHLENIPTYSNFNKLIINGKEIENGDKYSFEIGQEYQINNKYYLTLKQTTTPTLFIEIPQNIYSTKHINISKETEYFGNYFTTDENGEIIQNVSKLKKLKGRGNSTWELANEIYRKYPLNITLDEATDFLNMGVNNKKYCLLAQCMDMTTLRSTLAFEIGNKIEIQEVPKYKIINLFINGEYNGIYLCSQKIDIGKNGLILDEPLGKILLEFDFIDRIKEENAFFITSEGQGITVKYPENISDDELNNIESKWNEVEKAVYAEDIDKIQNLLDIESFVKMYLIEEISKNCDAGSSSYYVLFEPEDNKWKATPVWDYDLAFGNEHNSKKLINGKYESPSTYDNFFARYKCMTPYSDGPQSVIDKLNFQAKLINNQYIWNNYVKRYWNEKAYLKIANLFDENLDGPIEKQYDKIKYDLELNEAHYGFVEPDVPMSVKENYIVQIHDKTKSFYNNRIEWINAEMQK